MIFLASPYRDPDPKVRYWRYEQAVLFCADHVLSDNHRPIYSPIVHWHPVTQHRLGLHEKDTAFWMGLNRPMLEICDALWVLGLPGWRESEGCGAEIDLVKGFGRPIVLCLPGQDGVHWHQFV